MFFTKKLMKATGFEPYELPHRLNGAFLLLQPILRFFETLFHEVIPKSHSGFLLEFAHEIGSRHENGLGHTIDGEGVIQIPVDVLTGHLDGGGGSPGRFGQVIDAAIIEALGPDFPREQQQERLQKQGGDMAVIGRLVENFIDEGMKLMNRPRLVDDVVVAAINLAIAHGVHNGKRNMVADSHRLEPPQLTVSALARLFQKRRETGRAGHTGAQQHEMILRARDNIIGNTKVGRSLPHEHQGRKTHAVLIFLGPRFNDGKPVVRLGSTAFTLLLPGGYMFGQRSLEELLQRFGIGNQPRHAVTLPARQHLALDGVDDFPVEMRAGGFGVHACCLFNDRTLPSKRQTPTTKTRATIGIGSRVHRRYYSSIPAGKGGGQRFSPGQERT